MSREKRNAAGTKSGKAVSHSVPVLTKPTSPTTAGLKPEASLRSAKSGREFEGRALISDKGAVPSPSLDTIQNNGDKPRDPYRLSRCRKLSLRGVPPETPASAKFICLTCKMWNCPRCGPFKANRYRKAIGSLAEANRLNIMLTLTLDGEKLKGEESTLYINRIFKHFRTYLKRKLGRPPVYIRILEYQKNGNAHLHILLNGYVPQAWISNAWASLGGGKIVDIRRVTMHKVSRYLSKYLTKQMLLSAPKRSRRVTTSRGLKLNPKTLTEWSWNLVSVPIERLHQYYWQQASNVQYDAEGNVTAFDLTFPPGDENR